MSFTHYEFSWDELAMIEKEALEVAESYDSAPEDTEFRYCPYCGELLVYNSMSYYEGFHIECA